VLLVRMRAGDFGVGRRRRVFAGRLQTTDPQKLSWASKEPKATRFTAQPNG
jgi:hypothetical protein